MAMPSSSSISWTDSSMNFVESKFTPTSIPSGRHFWTSASAARTRPGDLDRVRAALLPHAEALGRLPVHPGEPADVLEAVLDERDVLQVHRGARRRRRPRRLGGSARLGGRAGVALAEDDPLEGREIERLAHHPHVELAALRSRCGRRGARCAGGAGPR